MLRLGRFFHGATSIGFTGRRPGGSGGLVLSAPVLSFPGGYVAGTNPPEWDSDIAAYILWDAATNSGDKQLMRWRRVNGGAWTTEVEQPLDAEMLTGGFTWPLYEAAKPLAGGYFEAQEQRVRYVANVETLRSAFSNSIVDALAAPPFTFASLFGGGDIGAAWNPTDLTKVFSDIAGSTAGVMGNPVGNLTDLSGKGNTLTASSNTNRPTLTNSDNGIMTFDGVDDSLGSLTGGGQYAAGAQTFIALVKGANGSGCIAAETSTSTTVPIYAPGLRGSGAGGSMLNYQRNNASSAISDNVAVVALDGNSHILVSIDDGTHVKESIDGGAFVFAAVNPYTRNGPLSGGQFSIGAARRTGAVFGPFAGAVGAGLVIGRVLAGTLGTAGDEITKAYNLVAAAHGKTLL